MLALILKLINWISSCCRVLCTALYMKYLFSYIAVASLKGMFLITDLKADVCSGNSSWQCWTFNPGLLDYMVSLTLPTVLVVTGQQVNIKKTASLELVHLKIPNILSLIGYIINSWFVTHTVQLKVEFVGHCTTKYID